MPQRELEGAQADAAEAGAQLQAAQQALAALGGGRGAGTRFLLRAPLAGTVLERTAVRGRVLGSEQTLFVIGDLRRLWLVAHAFERDATALIRPSVRN